ncbi:hypothetical protein SCHPADRAFT_908430 [Schizopora paradoxa]|uniref:Smr domain-containing protein n=1 Tax=Schizopora paradoxa TaxID=27342 RepID=A0A0H2RA19_9AGAM|nr:hypothetical protein SCHPADRAFT_908430 [Schizopora paradoxa]
MNDEKLVANLATPVRKTYAEICGRPLAVTASRAKRDTTVTTNGKLEIGLARESARRSDLRNIASLSERSNSPLPNTSGVKKGKSLLDEGWQVVGNRKGFRRATSRDVAAKSNDQHGGNVKAHQNLRGSPTPPKKLRSGTPSKVSTRVNGHGHPPSGSWSPPLQHLRRTLITSDVEAVFHAHNPQYRKGCSVIDLHGLTVRQATVFVDEHIVRCKTEGVRYTIVITGKGTNSIGGKSRLRPVILERLRATPGVEPRVDFRNEGRIHVKLI